MEAGRPGLTARLLRLLIALQGWTVVSLALFYVDPGGVTARLDCARRPAPSADCLAAQAIVTDAWRTLHFWPQLGAIALGYAVVVLLFLRGARDGGRRGRSRGHRTATAPRHVTKRSAPRPRARPSRG